MPAGTQQKAGTGRIMTAENSHLDSPPSIEQRLAFMQLEAANREKLRALRPVIERELPKALDKFYQMVRKTPETSRFFSSDQHVAGAKNAQVGHWANIARATSAHNTPTMSALSARCMRRSASSRNGT